MIDLKLDEFISKDGLINLVPLKESITADNDNGILFLCYFLYLYKKKMNPSEKDFNENFNAKFVTTYYSLERKPGLSMRNPGRFDNASSHDNYLGTIAACLLFKINEIPQRIVEYGFATGFTYDARTPDEIKYRRWRQPSETCIYKLASFKYAPTILEWIWLIGNHIWGFFLKKDDSSNHLLHWLRYQAIEQISMQNQNKALAVFLGISNICKTIFNLILNKKTKGKGIEEMFHIYFKHPKHPCRILSNGINF